MCYRTQNYNKLRYFLELSYAGTRYHGWQSQPNAPTVQANVEKALSLLLRIPVKITGAGRTDTGVHARQMFAHFDVKENINPAELVYKLNSFLPDDIAIHRIHPVKDDAHARFDAISRSYRYYIHRFKDPFLTETSWYFPKDLDVDLMNEAASILMEYNDFKSFAKTHTDVKTYFCKLQQAEWQLVDNQFVFSITADRFLRNMVRAIVGTLVDVGLHKVSLMDFRQIIASRDRSNAGFSVPAKGLFLTEIIYPKQIFTAYGND